MQGPYFAEALAAAQATDPAFAAVAGLPPYNLAAGTQAFAQPAVLDELRTVFITGFPGDVKDRELDNLLKFVPGYEASQISWKSGQPQGFALFATSAAARVAIDFMSGFPFDHNCTLRCEMAHKNMFLKEEQGSLRLARSTGAGPSTLGTSGVPILTAAAPAGYIVSPATPLVGNRPQSFSPVTNTRDNPPCNTLFIGNLGDNVSEQELRNVFATQAGFLQMKLVRGQKCTTAFVEFADVTSAVIVHQLLQGAVLPSSDRGGIRIQYSKNPFGRRQPGGSAEDPQLQYVQH